MASDGWTRCFYASISVLDGSPLTTLRDARAYIAGLSRAEQHELHWRTATETLLTAAERGGSVMLADIALRQALPHEAPKPPPAPRKKLAKKCRIVG